MKDIKSEQDWGLSINLTEQDWGLSVMTASCNNCPF